MAEEKSIGYNSCGPKRGTCNTIGQPKLKTWLNNSIMDT